jgi:Holliday junction resolvase
VNKLYQKGRNKEYQIVKRLKFEGFDICQRTAGSHSPIDIIAINKNERRILLIQSKPSNFSNSAEIRLLNECDWLNGVFNVEFRVYTS